MATSTMFYVYSVDTSTGTTLQVMTTSTWNGPGVLVGGPFASQALAQAWIKANPQALKTTVLQQDQADVGQWVVIPEGEAGLITQALAYTTTDFATALVGTLKGDLAVGGDVTVSQLTSAQQVMNAETANLTLYKTQAEAQAAANAINGSNNPSQTDWEQGLLSLFGDVTSANFWVRAVKIGIGAAILIVGLAKLTGADQKVGGAAAKAVKIAPFL